MRMTYYLNASMTGDIIGRVVKTIGGDMNPMVLEYMDIRGDAGGWTPHRCALLHPGASVR